VQDCDCQEKKIKNKSKKGKKIHWYLSVWIQTDKYQCIFFADKAYRWALHLTINKITKKEKSKEKKKHPPKTKIETNT
jgi:hypothetical protein